MFVGLFLLFFFAACLVDICLIPVSSSCLTISSILAWTSIKYCFFLIHCLSLHLSPPPEPTHHNVCMYVCMYIYMCVHI
ncbi:hypothetical protein LDENG_00221440 [Lucifuga dentata]|nr:hypothetical protein LDENG_00221440 [Lucifuga dentata]